MIPYFKDNEVRDTGIIHNAILDQIKLLYDDNPEMAGELAISAIELVLTGDMSTNNNKILFLFKCLVSAAPGLISYYYSLLCLIGNYACRKTYGIRIYNGAVPLSVSRFLWVR